MDRLFNEVTKIYLAAFTYPLCEGADAAAGNHEYYWFAGCWVDDCLLLQVWHLAALGFYVAVADVVSRQWRFAGYHADFAHKGIGVSNAGMLPEPYKFGKSQRWTGYCLKCS